jgi:hypothetical protein
MINSLVVSDRPPQELAATEAFLESPNEESFDLENVNDTRNEPAGPPHLSFIIG